MPLLHICRIDSFGRDRKHKKSLQRERGKKKLFIESRKDSIDLVQKLGLELLLATLWWSSLPLWVCMFNISHKKSPLVCSSVQSHGEWQTVGTSQL